MTTLTKEQQQAAENGEPVTVNLNGTEFVILRKDIFERIRAGIPDDLPTIDEQKHLLRTTGEMAGWDDPDMDVYDAF